MRRCSVVILIHHNVLGAVHAVELRQEVVTAHVGADALGLVEASTQMPVSAPLASKPMITVRIPPSKPFSSALIAVLPSGALTTPVMPAVV